MQDSFVDVTFEVPALQLATQVNPTQYVLEKMRDRADRLCDVNGGRLRSDRAPEINVHRALSPAGDEMVLCASRWAVVIPDAVEATVR